MMCMYISMVAYRNGDATCIECCNEKAACISVA